VALYVRKMSIRFSVRHDKGYHECRRPSYSGSAAGLLCDTHPPFSGIQVVETSIFRDVQSI
jgi:hypothetical protein